MSRFSSLLNQYIEEKGVKLYGLSRLCQIDRTTLYRFTHGRQCPSSSDLVYRLADALGLMPQQKELLYEAWEITNTGERLWKQRRAVEHFLLNFPKAVPLNQPPFPKEKLISEIEELSLFEGRRDFLHFLRSMFIGESSLIHPELMLLLQPEQGNLSDILPVSLCSNSFKICHIICLNNHASSVSQYASPVGHAEKEEETIRYSSHSVECLEALMPFYISQPDFHSFYYYDDVTAHFDSVSLMPCMIISSDLAVTCSADLSFGIVHTNPSIISMLRGIFRKYKAAAHPMAVRATWGSFLFKESLSSFQTRDSVCFSSLPHIFSWLTPDILRKYWRSGVAESEDMFSDCSRCLSIWKETAENSEIICYVAKNGLERFMATGCISCFPEGLLHPLSCQDRRRYLEYLYQIAKDHPIHLIKGTLEQVPGNFVLYVNAQTLVFVFPENSASMAALTIREPGLVHSFSDLFASFGESAVFSRQETCEYIKKML